MQRKTLLSLFITTGTYQEFIEQIIELAQQCKSSYVCVANVHMLIEAYNTRRFAAAINNADMITPDGKPLTWALRLFHNIKQDRVAGMDLLPDLLQQAALKKVAVYFYGGTDSLLTQTKELVAKNYPSLMIAGSYSPPFRILTPDEEDTIAATINHTGARLIFVVLGCPKQEQWMAAMKGKINGVMIGIGGALPVLVGSQKRAPVWMQHNGLEWLYRLLQEPKRLFKRYAITNTLFLILLAKELIKTRLFH